MNIGIIELQKQLEELGHETIILNNFVCFEYHIPHGRFKGKTIEIALEAPQFPLNPPVRGFPVSLSAEAEEMSPIPPANSLHPTKVYPAPGPH